MRNFKKLLVVICVFALLTVGCVFAAIAADENEGTVEDLNKLITTAENASDAAGKYSAILKVAEYLSTKKIDSSSEGYDAAIAAAYKVTVAGADAYVAVVESDSATAAGIYDGMVRIGKLLGLFELLIKERGEELKAPVAVKVHSGEVGNQNFIRADFWKPIIDKVGGTVVECNTAYEGKRNTTKKHLETLEEHGWSKYFQVDLLDANGPDLELSIPNGKVIKKNYVGKNIVNYDSMLVLSHFKGHPMGGFGGALKQLSIGVASSYGKAYIHGAGEVEKIWTADHDLFLESMADSASSVVDLFKGNIVYINVMKNMSVDCDCCSVAEDPCMKDIGILASLDPIAIDKACVDLVYQSNDEGKFHLIKIIESRNGILTVEASAKLGFGSIEYELIEIE